MWPFSPPKPVIRYVVATRKESEALRQKKADLHRQLARELAHAKTVDRIAHMAVAEALK